MEFLLSEMSYRIGSIKTRGSIFQNEFLGGVLLIFDLPGVVIEMGFYWLDQNTINKINHGT